MQSFRRVVFILHPNAGVAERMRRAVPPGFRTEVLTRWSDLLERAQQAPPGSIVVAYPHASEAPNSAIVPEIWTLLHQFPSISVVVALGYRRTGYQDLLRLVQAGVYEVIDIEVERLEDAIASRLSAARPEMLRSLLASSLDVPLPGRSRAVLDAAIDVAAVGGYPRDLYEKLGISPSTALRWTSRAGLPPPRRVLLWMRLIYASALLDDPGHTVESAALACGYASTKSLRRAFAQVLGFTPSELREMGALRNTVRAFRREVVSILTQRGDL